MKTKYILAPYVRVGIQDSKLYLGFGSMQQIIEDDKDIKGLLELLAKLRRSSHSREDIEALATGNNCSAYVSVLFDNGFVMPEGMYDREDRYSRNWLYFQMQPGADPQTIQKNLSNKHVVILGAGGIGNMISPVLATAGVSKITLVDDDAIELSNLTRQYLFSEKLVGTDKVDSLASALKALNSEVEIDIIKLEVKSSDDLAKLPAADLIILSADSVGLVEMVNAYSVENSVPFINISYIQDIASWGPLVVPGKTGCMACQNHIASSYTDKDTGTENNLRTINSVYQAPSTGPINMLAASLAALDVLRYLGDYGNIQSLNCRLGLWTHDLHLERQAYSRSPDCKVCGSASA